MNQLSAFTNSATHPMATSDPTIDLMAYLFLAFIVYMLFSFSQMFRTRYIEGMQHLGMRFVAKSAEYCFLVSSACLGADLLNYEGAIYYGLDVVLAGLLICKFVKSDKLHRSEYLRHYNISKHKLMNRMIINLSYEPTHQDN